MVPILTADAFAALGAPYLVYVRPVKAGEVMSSVSPDVIEELALEPGKILYAVHRADGERLAVLTDREAAFDAALAHEFAPVSVH